MAVHEVTSKAEFNAETDVEGLVLVDFYATWCGPCKYIAPKIEELSNAEPTVAFLKVDVDKVKFTDIQGMPTFRAYRKGEMLGEVMGADLDAVKALVAKHKE